MSNSVLRCVTAETEKTIIDGFTITHGSGHEDLYGSSSAVGGGLLILGASPTIRNCVFQKNDVNYNGGAVYLARGAAGRFDSCTFLDNAAEKGGGVYSVQSKPVFTKCRFKTNDGRYSGGAMYNADGSLSVFEGCHFERNRAGYYGGGIYEYAGTSTLKGCIFDRNRATYKGGGVYNGYRGKSAVTNCKFLTIYDDVSGGDAPTSTAIAPNGACLLDDGACLFVSRQSCEDASGAYQGDGKTCADVASKTAARSSDLNSDGRVDDRDAMMLLLLWR